MKAVTSPEILYCLDTRSNKHPDEMEKTCSPALWTSKSWAVVISRVHLDTCVCMGDPCLLVSLPAHRKIWLQDWLCVSDQLTCVNLSYARLSISGLHWSMHYNTCTLGVMQSRMHHQIAHLYTGWRNSQEIFVATTKVFIYRGRTTAYPGSRNNH